MKAGGRGKVHGRLGEEARRRLRGTAVTRIVGEGGAEAGKEGGSRHRSGVLRRAANLGCWKRAGRGGGG